MTALYELAQEYRFLRTDLVDTETGEVNENTLTQLSSISESIEKKGISLVCVIKDMEYEFEAIKKERERMQSREKSIINQIDRLKEYLKSNMEACEIYKISCPMFDISIRKNPDSVEILDESNIKSEYKRMKIDINKSLIKEHLKQGIDVQGAILTRTSSLVIR
jgi:hypothetical protein